MFRLKQSIFLIIYLFTIVSVASENQYEIENFKDSWSSDVDVSGGVLTAYQLRGSISSVQIDKLYIGKAKNIDKLNIRILSIDGKYSAEFVIKFTPTENEWVEVKINETEHNKYLSTYRPEEVSVYAYQEVSHRRKKVHHVFPTSWGKPDLSDISFFVNSAGEFARLAFVDKTKNKHVKYCDAIDGEINTSYNYECKIKQGMEPENGIVIFTTTADSKGKKYKIWVSQNIQ